MRNSPIPHSAFAMGLIVALGFLTALPVPRSGASSPKALARSLAYFPLVGAVIGGVLAALDLALGQIFPAGPRAALLIVATVALTRGLHLDGLMDSCDGLFGGFTPERRLAIMRDSRAGAFGVLGALLDLLLRYAALTALEGPWRLAALLGGPILGRWALVYATVAFPYGRDEGLGLAFKEAAGRREVVLATLSAGVLLAALCPPWGAGALLPAWAATWLGARLVLRRIPGLTGDSYGALNEVVEVLTLLLLVAGQTLNG